MKQLTTFILLLVLGTAAALAQQPCTCGCTDPKPATPAAAQTVAPVTHSAMADDTTTVEVTQSSDQTAQFIGGDAKMFDYVYDHLPYKPWDVPVQGKLVLNVLVTATGDVAPDSVQVLSMPKGLEAKYVNQAIEVVKTLPKFKPGTIGGKPVGTWIEFPIRFPGKSE